MSKLNITNNNFQYINLRILSNYSKLKSIIKPDDLIAFCQQKSLPAVGLCDEMNLCGIVKFHKAAIKAGIKPITGCVVKIDDYGMLPLFIKNMKGYE